jgi:hypothetical protein
MTQFNEALFVEIAPYQGERPPHPHPIDDGKFDPRLVYKVLGIYNPSETSECYFMLANPQREIWFIPQRHVRAYQLIESDEFSLEKQGTGNVKKNRASASARGSESHQEAEGKSSIAGPMRTLPVGSNRLP